MTGNR